jgi:hypothetical protein
MAADTFGQLLADDVKRRFSPVLRVTTRVQRPVMMGFFRPTILIPIALNEPDCDRELLRLSLLHEIAHGDQSDAWFGTIASLAQTVWFFLPQIWWLRSQLMIDQEFLADRAAALRYGTSSDYASSLLSLAQGQPSHSAHDPAQSGVTNRSGVANEVRSPLSQRVLMLLYCPFRVESRAPRSWSWILRITLVAATIVAACLCIRWPDASALEHIQKNSLRSPSPQFRVKEFTIEPRTFSHDGPAISYVMPVALPARFVLSVEVFANLADLGKLRIAGHPLSEGMSTRNSSHSTLSLPEQLEVWHRVRLVRQGEQVSLSIDGETSSVLSGPKASTEWLTFEPNAQRVTRFRNLVVE